MNANFGDWLTGLNRKFKVALLWVGDFVTLQVSACLAFILSGEDFNFSVYYAWAVLAISPVLFTPIFIISGMYNHMVRFIGINDIWRIIKCVSIYSLLWGSFIWLCEIKSVPRMVPLTHLLLSLIGIGGGRIFAAWLIQSSKTKSVQFNGDRNRGGSIMCCSWEFASV
jgi:FlaA1/EpsC-like NDP-sugar epimerase